MIQNPTIRTVTFHGRFSDKYQSTPIRIGADSMFTLCNILFVQAFPQFLKEEAFRVIFEDYEGNYTELIDPMQQLPKSFHKVHIVPELNGSVLSALAYQIILAIVIAGVSILLAPKPSYDADDNVSGSVFITPENLVGQGGVQPVVLGKRLVESRVISYSIDSTLRI